jgi:hypothetical protein
LRDTRTGEEREEHLYMVAVHGALQANRQLLIHYGDAYLRQFAQTRAPAAPPIDVSALNLLRPLSPPAAAALAKAEPPSSPPAESAADAVIQFIVKAGGDPADRRPAREGDRILTGSVVSPPLGDASRPETQSVVVVTPEKAVLDVTYAQLRAVGRGEVLRRTGTAPLVVNAGFSLKRLAPPPPAPASRRRR